VALEHLSQTLDTLDPEERVLSSVERVKRVTKTADGEITATSMLERFGFTGDRLTARIGDLSGGERRRLQLMRLLLAEPNVLLLDEPTNDLDIETLNVLEDFLDRWPGTLVVVSHDRYFLERVTDSVWALMGDGSIAQLPRGVDEYLERREADLRRADGQPGRADRSHDLADGPPQGAAPGVPAAAPTSAQETREAKKAMARLERQLERTEERERELHALMAEHASDHERLAELGAQLKAVVAERESIEEEWLEAGAVLE
jgi:ATP-binding cassette subfamily F protein uup